MIEPVPKPKRPEPETPEPMPKRPVPVRPEEQKINVELVKHLTNEILSIVSGYRKIDILYALAGAEVVVHEEALRTCIESSGAVRDCIAGFISTASEIASKVIASVLLSLMSCGRENENNGNIM